MSEFSPYSADLPFVVWAAQKDGFLVRDTRDGRTYLATTMDEVHAIAADLQKLGDYLGAGDVVHAIAERLGIARCPECEKRQAKLNAVLPKLWRRRS
jgi:hypothetical protein